MRYQPKHRADSTSVSSHVGRLAVSSVAVAAVAAAPLAVAAPADAASGKTWNRLADCESGGRWHIDTGNGYYGGLQFSASTWTGYGGGMYANLASGASRDEQIRIAEKVLSSQGWGAWPYCSSMLGLDGSDASGTRQHTYVVKPGDTLRGIAHHKHVKGGADRLFRLNRHRLDGDRDNLRADMKLRLYRWR